MQSINFVNSEEVTRDYLPHIKEPIMRECCLLPWFPEKLTDEEWINKLSDETTLEFVRKELSELQMKVCSNVLVFLEFSVRVELIT